MQEVFQVSTLLDLYVSFICFATCSTGVTFMSGLLGFLVSELLFMQIGPFQGSNSENARVKVTVKLNLHSIVSVESAWVSRKSHFHLLSCFVFHFLGAFTM